MNSIFAVFARRRFMPQLHLYVPEALAEELRSRAQARGMSLSAYLARIVRGSLGRGWPPGFFDEVVGGWRGEALERGPQGTAESREEL